MKRLLLSISLLLCFAVCISLTCFAKDSYTQISQDEAREMMEKDDGHVVVDVRRQDEYDEGHIPGAICVPNESIGCDSPEALPDYDQIILIYCRSGRRSKEAAKKLAGMGYTNIYEFGGIIDWTGEIVTEETSGSIHLMIDGTEETTKTQKYTASTAAITTTSDTLPVYTIMNVLPVKRKVILKKVAATTYTPLEGAQFRIFRADLSEVINSDYKNTSTVTGYESLASGVYFIDTLPEGKYYLVETKAPNAVTTTNADGTTQSKTYGAAGKVFTLEIKDGMKREVEEKATISTTETEEVKLVDNLRTWAASQSSSSSEDTETTTP